MNKYNGLLNLIARELNIPKGANEEINSWEARIIYSVTGRMAYAALHDNSGKEEPVSIIHMKRRMQNILESYIELYPEIQNLFDLDGTEDEIYNIFQATGQLYHTSNHIIPAMPQSSLHSGIVFTRGMALSQNEYVSGIGSYLFDNHEGKVPLDVREMFQLHKKNLQTIWKDTLTNIKFSLLSTNQLTQFLRLKPPYTDGYWVNKPTSDGISVCRVGEKGKQLYYLYKLEGDKILVNQLPSWATEKYNYAIFSNACLEAFGTLPESIYRYDGDIVLLNIHYLMPPPELNFIKLYSWPDSYLDLPNDFQRVFTLKVFDAVKNILEAEGYKFKEA